MKDSGFEKAPLTVEDARIICGRLEWMYEAGEKARETSGEPVIGEPAYVYNLRERSCADMLCRLKADDSKYAHAAMRDYYSKK
jgi:hypothetical protein